MNKRKLQYVTLLISVLLIAIISLANMQTVTVNFLLVQFKLPLIILILICVLLGSLVTFLVSLPNNFSLKHELKSAKKQLGQKMSSEKEEKIEQIENKSTD